MAAADIVTRSSPDGKGRRPVTTAANADNSVEVRPNRGATISDIEAIGPESQPLQEWQKEAGIDTSKQTKLVKLAHVRYQHPDLTDLKKFLLDFGMHVAKQTDDEMWFRGYGADPYVYYARKGPKKFLGGSFQVESEEELEKASRLPGAQPPIQDLTDAPGGGSLLTLLDPEGFPINLIHGQTPAATGAAWPANLVYNPAGPDKPRVRSFNRFTPGPAAVHKLGHYGLCVQDVPTQLRWYTRNFNFAPTDFLYVRAEGAAERREVGVFMHLDRGETCVDHHAFFISANPTAHVHHASFEVHDYDTQHLGHQWLARRGYTSVWGVGRHVLGSQIFDYWWDPTGNMIEHYADGDLVNKDTPVGWGPAGDESLAVWGPEVPSWFLH